MSHTSHCLSGSISKSQSPTNSLWSSPVKLWPGLVQSMAASTCAEWSQEHCGVSNGEMETFGTARTLPRATALPN